MKILTAGQMARWERRSIRRRGISARVLMARAAAGCGEALLERCRPKSSARIVIVSGPGNNGGDGFSLAAWLSRRGFTPTVYFTGSPQRLSEEAFFFHEKVSSPILPLRSSADLKRFRADLKRADILADAVFGIGLNRPLRGFYRDLVQYMNRSGAFKLAVDIPTGLCADSGKVLGDSFRADLTVTFQAPKWGQVSEAAWEYVGALEVRSLKLPNSDAPSFQHGVEWSEGTGLRPYFPARKKSSHKGSVGSVCVLAGSQGMPGAGYLCAISALRSGAGLVRWALPGYPKEVNWHHPEVILKPVASQGGVFSTSSLQDLNFRRSEVQAVALGPGIGQDPSTLEFLAAWLQRRFRPMVLDADALNLLAQQPRLLRQVRDCILTPHPKEMARLCGLRVGEVLASRLSVARRFARRYGVWLILKGYRSVIAGPRGEIFLNSTGGPNLATAGSGDVLTGVIAGLLAQGFKAGRAALAGVYLHGLAGDLWMQEHGDRGMLASDLAEWIPQAILHLRKGGGRR